GSLVPSLGTERLREEAWTELDRNCRGRCCWIDCRLSRAAARREARSLRGEQSFACQYDFYKGMFCELGGEFVDTAHEDPAPSNDTFYSDLGFQTLWETSGVQPGGAGIITDYLGSKPGINDAKSALDAFRTDIPKMSPKMAESLDPNAVTAW